jgi:N-acetylmuramoyl-L-alanine amidase
LTTGDDSEGTYGHGTTEAVRAFQRQRGLRIDGICGRDTWSSMEEAGYQLGDRLLFQRSPMLRGDDVADLQRRLGGLGFDAGRVDGIFGPDTARALTQFQRNAGTVTDGIFGPDTLAALRRVGGHVRGSLLAAVREEEHLHGPRALGPTRVVLGSEPLFVPLATELAARLTRVGCQVSQIDCGESAAMAAAANATGGDLYVHLAPADEPGIGIAFYSFGGFTSLRGQRLAELLLRALPGDRLGPRHDVDGMRLIILRETRMPAVHLELGPPEVALEVGSQLLAFVGDAILEWSTTAPPRTAGDLPLRG